ncbi:MAG TPA: aconitate hydratase B, partial [Geobacteraceae bacterium]|nr:aconitate hydratase B [Geobacteraceae bacterium]
MIDQYLQQEAEREALGIPARPLDPEQTAELCMLLENPPAGKEEFLLHLIRERVSPGVDPAAEVKAAFLAGIVNCSSNSPLVSPREAVKILGTMLVGYNVAPLVGALKDVELAEEAARALSSITLVYDCFDEVAALARTNAQAARVLEAWANAEWFTNKPGIPETIRVKVFKVDGEINTDDLSPAGDAWSRPD